MKIINMWFINNNLSKIILLTFSFFNLFLIGRLMGQSGIQNFSDLPCTFYHDSITNKIIYTLVDKMPAAKGGEEKILKEIQNKLKYPSNIGSMDTKIILQFIVETNGILTSKRILQDINDTELGKQLLVLIDRLKWIPGVCNGKIVPVLYQLPVRICIK